MMNILHKTAQVADFRPGFVPKVQLRAPRVAGHPQKPLAFEAMI